MAFACKVELLAKAAQASPVTYFARGRQDGTLQTTCGVQEPVTCRALNRSYDGSARLRAFMPCKGGEGERAYERVEGGQMLSRSDLLSASRGSSLAGGGMKASQSKRAEAEVIAGPPPIPSGAGAVVRDMWVGSGEWKGVDRKRANDNYGLSEVSNSYDPASQFGTPEEVDVEALEEGALRAIYQAEKQCRDAAQKLLEAQSRLESARLAAAELRARREGAAESTGEASSSETTAVLPEVLTPDEIDDNAWRDGVETVEAIVRAEEQRRAKLEAFQKATDELRQRLRESPIQATINDQHIEFLDRGGQYHVASWVINEVEGFWSKESGEYSLAVNINLDLAVQGCDPQTAHFLQDLPYGQVLGIKADKPRNFPVHVDYWDGSSWETDSGDAEMDLMSGPDGVTDRLAEPWSVTEYEVLDGGAELESSFPSTFPGGIPGPHESQTPVSARMVLEYRDGQLCGVQEELVYADGSELQLPGFQRDSMNMVPLLPPQPQPLAMLEGPKQPTLRRREVLASLGLFAYVTTMMVKACELSTLVTDAYVLLVACTISLTMAWAVGIVNPPVPAFVSNLLPAKDIWPSRSWWEARAATQGARPWEQVVFWLGVGATILSLSTVTAIVVKAIQAAVLIAYQSAFDLMLPFVPHALAAVGAPRMVLRFAGILSASRLVADSMPYLVTALAWMLLLLSLGVATTSVSLILLSYTDRPNSPKLSS